MERNEVIDSSAGMQAIASFFSMCRKLACAGLVVAGAACSSLLPNAEQETRTPWTSYAEAQAMYDRIIPGTTTLAELKAFGIDPDRTPNVAVLGHADLLRRLAASQSFDLGQVDPALRDCAAAGDACYGFELEQVHLDRKRIGNFWVDFFAFKRKVDVTGWQFDVVVAILDDVVVYKQWSGKPNIRQGENERNPLGPVQGIGPSLIHP